MIREFFVEKVLEFVKVIMSIVCFGICIVGSSSNISYGWLFVIGIRWSVVCVFFDKYKV